MPDEMRKVGIIITKDENLMTQKIEYFITIPKHRIVSLSYFKLKLWIWISKILIGAKDER